DAPRARLEASEHEANLAGRSDAGGANQRGALALVRAQHFGRVEIAPVLEPFTELFDLLALKARDLAPLERIHEAPRIAAEAHGELGDGLDEPVRYGPRRFERMPVDRLAAALHVGVDPRARDAAARVETLAGGGVGDDAGCVSASEHLFERADVRNVPVRDQSIQRIEIVSKQIEDVDLADAAPRIERRNA